MAQEYSVLVGINSSLATKGAREFDRASQKVQRSSDKMDKRVKGSTQAVNRLKTALAGVGFAGFAAALTSATRQAIAFDTAMTEVSTLIDETFDPTNKLSDAVKDLSREFGQSPTKQAKALYQVISAGAKDAADATRTLEAANKLAVGGLTDVATAADGLTSIMNAYGLSSEATTDISDAMFVAMRAGKTTIEELSGSIGRLAPLTAATGVSIDEMLAATSALTTVGLSTSEAMNGLKQALSNILKPTEQALELADKLKIEFSAAALESKGLAQFMAELSEAADGNSEVITTLFGSVEAMNVAMALASEDGGAKLADILEDMRNKAGETETAFDKVSQSAEFQANVLKSNLSVAMTNLGATILPGVNAVLKTLNENFDAIVRVVQTLAALIASVLTVRFIAAAAAMIKTAGAVGILTGALTGLRTLLATLGGPVGVIAIAVATLLTWSSTAEAATPINEALTASLDDAARAFRELEEAQRELALTEAREQLADADKEVRMLQVSVNALAATLKQKQLSGAPTERVERRLLEQRAALEAAEQAYTQIETRIETFNGVLREENEVLEEITVTAKKRTLSILKSADAIERERKALEKQRKEQERAAELAKEQADLRKTAVRQLEELRAGTDKVALATLEHRNAIEDLRESQEFAKLSAEEQLEMLRLLEEQHQRNIEELENTCDANKKVVECTASATSELQKLWERGLENIQDAFAQAFRNMLDGAGNVFDGILDAFKDMIANMLAAWFASGITGLFSGQGLGGFVSGAGSILGGGGSGGAGGLGNLAGMVGGFEGLITAGAFFFEGAKQFLLGNATSTQLGSVSGFAGAGAAFAGAGLGAITGTAVDAIFGSRGDPKRTLGLAAIGGAIGSIWGPIGSLIGGAIGSFASNLIGGAKKLEQATLEFELANSGFAATVETVISKQRSFFRGRKFKTKREDIDLTDLSAVFAEFESRLRATAEALGATFGDFFETFEFSREINIKGKSKEQIAELMQRLISDAFRAATGGFLRAADGISDRLRATVAIFKSDAEEFVRAFELAAAIDLAQALVPSEAAAEALAQQNKTLTESYREVLAAYDEVVASYDGSLPALEALAIASATLAQAQATLALAYDQVGRAVSDLFQTSAQTIREALLSEQELYDLRQSQVDDLVAQLNQATDPAEIQRLSEEINRLTLDAFNLLDEGQQQELGGGFIEFLEGIDALVSGRIGDLVGDLDAEARERADNTTGQLMNEAARIQDEAARRFSDSVDRWEEMLRNLGGYRTNEMLR